MNLYNHFDTWKITDVSDYCGWVLYVWEPNARAEGGKDDKSPGTTIPSYTKSDSGGYRLQRALTWRSGAMIKPLSTVIGRFVDRTEILYECRNCGTNLDASTSCCPACDATDVAIYELPVRD